MPKQRAGIFRIQALRHYASRGNHAVLPKLKSPRAVGLPWVLLGLLVICGAVISLARVPVYATAAGILIERNSTRVLVLLVPPEHLQSLRIGQTVLVKFGPNHRPIRGSIFAVEPEILKPAEVRERLPTKAWAALRINEARSVALARFNAKEIQTDLPGDNAHCVDASIELGQLQLVSLFSLRHNLAVRNLKP